MENFYNTLGVNENANPDEIKRAYRKLAAQHHPDKGGDTAKFQQIQKAYETLGDQNRRAQYDAERRGGFRFNVNGQEFGGMPPGMDDIFRNFGFSFGPGFGPQGDPFAQFRQNQQPKRNKDIRVQVEIDLVDTLTTQTKTISIQTTNGSRQEVEVTIPRGIHTGNSVKYPNLGDNFFDSLPRGDLYVNFMVRNDPRFEVHNGIDLVTGLDIDALEAIIGCTKKYTNLEGQTQTIDIPAGVQHGEQFRIPNQGLYIPNQNLRGSLFLIAQIKVPKLQPEQLNIIRNLLNTK